MCKYLFLILPILSSCGGMDHLDRHGHITISINNSETEVVNIINAIDMWRNSTNGFVNFTLDIASTQQDLEGVFIYPDELPPQVVAKTKLHPGEPITIRFDRDNIYSDKQMTIAIAHELGHALGILNHLNLGSIMQFSTKYDEYPTCIDQETIDQLCKIYHCNLVTNCDPIQ